MMGTGHRWQPLSPPEAARVFGALGCQWWVAGGWAIDLFLGRQTRRHADIDVSVLRRDQPALARLLADWELCVAHDGALTSWDGTPVDAPRHQFWARLRGSGAWAFEVLLEDADGDRWLYRRDHRVTMPITEIGATAQDGVPYLRPGMSLLYKSPRFPVVERNDADFEAAVESLTDADRGWLRNALALTQPFHPWLARL